MLSGSFAKDIGFRFGLPVTSFSGFNHAGVLPFIIFLYFDEVFVYCLKIGLANIPFVLFHPAPMLWTMLHKPCGKGEWGKMGREVDAPLMMFCA